MKTTTVNELKSLMLIETACNLNNVDRETLLRSKKKEVKDLRNQCIYLVSRNTQLTFNEIAKMFKVSERTIEKVVKTIGLHKMIYRNTLRSLIRIVTNSNEMAFKNLI